METDKFTTEDRKLLKKLRKTSTIKQQPTSRWEDLPPVIDPESIVWRDLLEDVKDNGQKATVGQFYMSWNRRKVVFGKQDKRPLQAPSAWASHSNESSDSSQESERTKEIEGYEIWSVIQPVPITPLKSPEPDIRYQLPNGTKASTEEQRENHARDVEIWRNLPMKTRMDTSVKSLPILPNGNYFSERFQPKIKEGETWRPATTEECAIWYTIPESQRRIDYLEGVIPDE